MSLFDSLAQVAPSLAALFGGMAVSYLAVRIWDAACQTHTYLVRDSQGRSVTVTVARTASETERAQAFEQAFRELVEQS